MRKFFLIVLLVVCFSVLFSDHMMVFGDEDESPGRDIFNARGYVRDDKAGGVGQDEDKNGNKANSKCCACGECREGDDDYGDDGYGGDDYGGGYGGDDDYGGDDYGGGYGGDVESNCPKGLCCTCGIHTKVDKDGNPIPGSQFTGATHDDGSYDAEKDHNDNYANCCMSPPPTTSTPGNINPTYTPPEPGPEEMSLYICDTDARRCERVVYKSSAIDACRYECEPYCDKAWLRTGCMQGTRNCFSTEESCMANCTMPYNFKYYCKSMVPTPWIWNADLTPTPDPLTPTPIPNPLTPAPVPTVDDISTSCTSWANWYLDCPCLQEDGCFANEGVCRTNCAPWSICDVEEKSCYRGYYLEGGSKCNVIEYPNYCYRHATEEVPIGVIDAQCNASCAGGGSSPTLPDDSIDISNESDLIIIDPDSEGRNHVCEVDNKDKTVLFYVTVESSSGGDSLSTVGLRFDYEGDNNLTILGTNLEGVDRNSFVASGVGMGFASVQLTSWEVVENMRTVVFRVEFEDGFPDDLSSLQVSAIDTGGNSMMATDTGRKFRYWDCKVDYSGSLYDDSDNPVDRQVCSVSGYSTLASEINFSSLEFVNTDDIMPAIKIDGSSFIKTLGRELLWGSSYTAVFNEGLLADNPLNRTIDLNTGVTLCHNTPGNVLDLGASSGGSFPAFPYATNPMIRLDFSWLQYSEAWFQVIGGGIQAGGNITNMMPGSEKMSLSNLDLGANNDSWVIAEGMIVKGSGNDFGSRNWNLEGGSNLINKSYGYNYFYNQYKVNKGKGEVVADWSNIRAQAEGVYFVNSNLVVDQSNSISSDKYLLVIVKGNLIINEEVDKLEGIFIVDGNVLISGENSDDKQLIINGMIYAGGSVNITRSYATHNLNNTLPATVIYFRPDLIFNMPGDLTKTVSGWREGR